MKCVFSLGQATGRDQTRVASGGRGLRRKDLDNGHVINVHTLTIQLTKSVYHVVKKGKEEFLVFLVACLVVKPPAHQLHCQCPLWNVVRHLNHQTGYAHSVPIVMSGQPLSVSSVVTVKHGMSQ